ncbi:hypothetical protein ACIG87_29840 [Micromonospora sp. NPDC051925]|uniref:hypothetical protein n=1 Tax=Micromonospora sp. NPDC051925 TaxID=3364288 RepID=UPI0037C97C2A
MNRPYAADIAGAPQRGGSLDWYLLHDPAQAGVQRPTSPPPTGCPRAVGQDTSPASFCWIAGVDVDVAKNTVSFVRIVPDGALAPSRD